MGFLKKLVNKATGTVKKIGTAVSKATTFVGKITGNPIASAVGNATGKMASAIKVDNSEASGVSQTTVTSPTNSPSMSKTRGLTTASGGNFFSNLWAKFMAFMDEQKAKSPIIYWALWLLIVGVIGTIIWFVVRLFRKKKVGSRTSRTRRRTARKTSTHKHKSAPRATAPRKRSLSAAQKAALAKGRAALKLKRKR